MHVVEYHRHSVAWRLGQTDISWDYAFKDLRTKEAPQIGSNLLRKRGAVVVHREENALDRERGLIVRRRRARVSSSSETPSRARIFALNWNKDGVAGGQGIHRKNIE